MAVVDERAAAAGLTRAEWVRRTLAAAITDHDDHQEQLAPSA